MYRGLIRLQGVLKGVDRRRFPAWLRYEDASVRCMLSGHATWARQVKVPSALMTDTLIKYIAVDNTSLVRPTTGRQVLPCTNTERTRRIYRIIKVALAFGG